VVPCPITIHRSTNIIHDRLLASLEIFCIPGELSRKE
jgi:hypothetical protein